MKEHVLKIVILAGWTILSAGCTVSSETSVSTAPWPALTSECRPWTYWWQMASATDPENITRQLEQYKEAGLGGVHIIPIYGAKGYEDRYIDYLSPKWFEMLDYTVREGRRLGLGVDMTLGTGWCFGGPTMTDEQANAVLQHNQQTLEPGQTVTLKSTSPLCVVAYGPQGQTEDLSGRIRPDGTLDWTAPEGTWRLYELGQKPSGRKVKRAAPGGEGHMLNPFYTEAMKSYLKWFDEALERYDGAMPRGMYHDSYEYVCNWSPDLLREFEKRRGYRLQDHLPAFFGEGDAETTARLKGDYRLTVSEMMLDTFALWADWSHAKGCITRNEAHGAPANLLDFYALSDSPETEFFRFDRNPLVAKFASSAAHVAGRKYVSSETGTWLKEHYHVSLGHLKNFIDGLFISGINHMFYHGTCYSPVEAPWPGWAFYASTQMNPRNSIWHDVDALNGYLARCQSVLQAGQPDNDLLVYWPIHDFWHNEKGMNQDLTIHGTDWLVNQPIGGLASRLWEKGYAFDYISDLQLQKAVVKNAQVEVPGGSYKAILVPACTHIPAETLSVLHEMAKQGACVLFEKDVPQDVPGLGDLEKNRASLKAINKSLKWNTSVNGVQACTIGKGIFCRGDQIESMLNAANIQRETLVDHRGLQFIRRKDDQGYWYFITNQDSQFTEDPNTAAFKGDIVLSRPAKSVMIMDPMTGQSGFVGNSTPQAPQASRWLQLEPGQSLILRMFDKKQIKGKPWHWYQPGEGTELNGTWNVEFIEGRPQLPPAFMTDKLDSWTKQGGPAECFAGTARYSIVFDAPKTQADAWRIDLGRVASSARVRLNGQDLGTAVSVPFTVQAAGELLKPEGNRLEIEVTNLSANRIRDLDIRGVEWKYFNDINIVNIDYKKFDASQWDLVDSGLLGPVRLVPLNVYGPK
jgi:hypothetical protein